MLTKPSAELTLFDTLSRLTFARATKLLGPDGDHLIAAGGKYDVDINAQVKFDPDRFRLSVDSATVTLALSPAARNRLEWRCDTCDVPCEHVGADALVIIWKWRRTKLPSDYRPPQWSGHTFLELGWTVVPFLIVTLVGAASFHVMQQDEVVPAASEGTVEIHIVAHQFGWKYEYSNGVVIDQELGDPAAAMVIPVGRFIRIRLDSTDVIHSFWVPAITGKTDAVPGYSNYTWMKVNEPGEWRGQCTELCGVDHAQMLIDVKAVPETDFQAWLHNEKLMQSQPSPKASPAASPKPPVASPSPGASPSPSAGPSPAGSPSPSASPSPSGSPSPSAGASPSASPSPKS